MMTGKMLAILLMLWLDVAAVQATHASVKASVYDAQNPALPVVLMHGMGDAAKNSGMQHIRKLVSERLGNAYVTNIQIGDSRDQDIHNSYFVSMPQQLEVFAQEIQKDPNLAGGFNAAGFSQGNLLIRAYVERYNNPPVRNFISFHGPLAGVGALPECRPTEFICKEVNRLIGTGVYLDTVQHHLAQSNYFRDPNRIDQYLKHALLLPDINNEKPGHFNATYKKNFAKLQNLVLVRAKQDTMVFPKESEWFGAYADGDFHQVLRFNETKWYQEDSFGLRTLHEAGRVHFFETDNNHLVFSNDFLLKMVTQFFSPSLAAHEPSG